MSRYATADSMIGMDDTFLHDVALEVDEKLLPLDDIYKRMVQIIESFDKPVVGLAANQVGWPFRIIVVMANINTWDPELMEEPDWLFAVNPKILERQGIFRLEEGCLSYPDNDPVVCMRPFRMHVEYTNRLGVRCRRWAEKDEAAVWSHEIDHLNGKTIYDGTEGFSG